MAEICHFEPALGSNLLIYKGLESGGWFAKAEAAAKYAKQEAVLGPTEERDMKKENGFSLLELLIVVAIILIIATIAIPSLLRSRQSANESHAVANLRTLNTAEVQYVSTYQVYGGVSDMIAVGLLDDRYTTGSSGYSYAVELSGTSLDYTARADALSANSGRFDYFTKPDYVIRYSTDAGRAPTGLAGEPVQ